MDPDIDQLADYCERRVGDSLRAVGYHTPETYDIAYVRDDLRTQYPPEAIDQFIETSRDINTDLQSFDEGMGSIEASLHILEEGLAIQFHLPDDTVAFVTMEKSVGQNFLGFVEECETQLQ